MACARLESCAGSFRTFCRFIRVCTSRPKSTPTVPAFAKATARQARPARRHTFFASAKKSTQKMASGGHVLRIADWLWPTILLMTWAEPYSTEAEGLLFAPGRFARGGCCVVAVQFDGSFRFEPIQFTTTRSKIRKRPIDRSSPCCRTGMDPKAVGRYHNHWISIPVDRTSWMRGTQVSSLKAADDSGTGCSLASTRHAKRLSRVPSPRRSLPKSGETIATSRSLSEPWRLDA